MRQYCIPANMCALTLNKKYSSTGLLSHRNLFRLSNVKRVNEFGWWQLQKQLQKILKCLFVFSLLWTVERTSLVSSFVSRSRRRRSTCLSLKFLGFNHQMWCWYTAHTMATCMEIPCLCVCVCLCVSVCVCVCVCVCCQTHAHNLKEGVKGCLARVWHFVCYVAVDSRTLYSVSYQERCECVWSFLWPLWM